VPGTSTAGGAVRRRPCGGRHRQGLVQPALPGAVGG
jgi:hypothetical protein